MARTKSIENVNDPATGRPLPRGVTYRGPAQYRARKLVDGQRVTKTFEAARLAREWLEETAVRIREGTYVDRRPLEAITLGQLVERFVKSEMQDGGPRRGAAEDRGHIPAFLQDPIGKLPMSKLTPSAVRDFRNRQAETFSAATVVKRLNLLATILNHAVAEWDLPLASNPAAGKKVQRPRGADVKRDRRLEAGVGVEGGSSEREIVLGEEDRLLAAVATSPVPDDVRVVRLAIAQAMRQGEILALRWGDVDFDRRLIMVRGRHGRGTKTAKHQKTARRKGEEGWEIRPLVPDAAALLLEKRGDEKPGREDLVFSVGGPNAFKVRIGRLIARSGLQDLRFHDLRHVATSRLAKRYPNPLDLMRVTGHKDLKSLDRYYQPDLTELATGGMP